MDTYLEKRKMTKESLELEIEELEKKLDAYHKAINNMFHDHIEIINNLK